MDGPPYGTGTLDPIVFAGALAVLTGIALTADCLPATRAFPNRLDPGCRWRPAGLSEFGASFLPDGSRCKVRAMAKRKVGRPRTRRPDLEPFTARFTPEAKKRLMALAQVSDRAAYTLLEEAFWKHWEQLPESRREAVESIVRAVDSARDDD